MPTAHTTIVRSPFGSYLRNVKSKDTSPELLVRKALWERGLRYRKHYSNLPGKPDIAFPGSKLAIFIHGCFWHRHNCKRSFSPKSNSAFWRSKFDKTIQRDECNESLIISKGWKVLTLWECEINENLDECLNKVFCCLGPPMKPQAC